MTIAPIRNLNLTDMATNRTTLRPDLQALLDNFTHLKNVNYINNYFIDFLKYYENKQVIKSLLLCRYI